MKFLTILVLFLSSMSFAGGVKTPHKTSIGKYSIWFVNSPDVLAWDDDQQMEFDDLVDDAIQSYCFKNILINRAQNAIDHERSIGKESGFVNAAVIHDQTSIIVKLRPEVEKLAKFLKDGTNKAAASYACP